MLNKKTILKRLGIIGGVLFLLLAGVLVFGPSVAEDLAFQNVAPANREAFKADYKRWKSERLHLPPEAVEVKPVSPELREAVQVFAAAWEMQGEKAKPFTNANREGTPDLKELSGTLAELAPLTRAFTALVRRTDYDPAAICDESERGKHNLNIGVILPGTRLLRLQALAAAQAGKPGEALEASELIVRAGLTSPYETMLIQMIGMTSAETGVTTWLDGVRRCDDAALLRATLDQQNRLAGRLAFLQDRKIPPLLIDTIGTLRELKQQGDDIDFQDRTGLDLTVLQSTAFSDHLEKKVLPTIESGSPSAAIVRQQIESSRSNMLALTGQAHGLKGHLVRMVRGIMLPSIYCRIVPNLDSAFMRAQKVRVQFDLLRLETARKLYTIEKGHAPAKMEDLVPGILPELPMDWFADSKKPYHETGGEYYSVGPDGLDNGNRVTYDPSNGTISAGDLALEK